MRSIRATCLAGVITATAAASAAELPPVRVERVPNYVPRDVLEADTPVVQPTRLEPSATCAGSQITLFPPPGAAFPAGGGGSRVLFAPCGIPGDVVEWTAASIKVKVPEEASSGPVWLATAVSPEVSDELERGRSCRRSVARHDVVPERLETRCDPRVGDQFDPRAATLLRGIPVSPAAPDGALPQRAGPAGKDDPPACGIVGPDRRAPLHFGAPQWADVRNRVAAGEVCFESCQEIHTNKNFLVVNRPPVIARFLPAESQIRAPRIHRVERGENRILWQVDAAGAPTTLTFSTSTGTDQLSGLVDEVFETVDEPMEATLKGENACGTSTVTLVLEPVSTLRLSPEDLTVVVGAPMPLTVRIDAPLDHDLELVLDNSSGGLFTLPPTVTLPAHATEVTVPVQAGPGAAVLGNDASLGQVTVRVANPAAAPSVVDGPEPARVRFSGGAPVGAPGPTDTLVTGTLRYRECMGADVVPVPAVPLDADRCVVTAAGEPVFKPIRRARVEVWDQSVGPNALRAVVDTDDAGAFQAIVPASGLYDVTVVATSFAGRVGFENDAVTWFWAPLRLTRPGVPNGTTRFDFDFARRVDARHFNALDAITRGLEYAVVRSGTVGSAVDETFRKTVVIPGDGVIGANTHRVGHATHIWIHSGVDVFEDEVLLHEYGHHMQHANGTYQIWGVFHQGCYATVVLGTCADRMLLPGGTDTAADVGCWVNSEQFAWFEGFPDYFERVVMDFDAGRSFTSSSFGILPFNPGPGRGCPLVSGTTAHFNHLDERITPAGVENYVSGVLRDLPGQTVMGTSGPLSRREIEEKVFAIFQGPLRDTRPTVNLFKARWSDQFPLDLSLAALLSTYGM
jgi:hypothetical protein